MLKVLRDNLKFLSWILWLVILVFIAFVFVDFGGVLGRAAGTGSAAVTVGGEAVSFKDFEREYRRLEEQYREAFGGRLTPEIVEQLQLPAQALERLVNRKLLAGEATRQGLLATDAEVQRAILGIPGMQDSGGRFVGADAYQGFLRANGYTPREFEALVREDVVIQKLTGALRTSIPVADAEVERAWRQENERAQVRFVLAPFARYAGRSAATSGQVTDYFEAHRDEFQLPDQRVVDYLLVDASRLRTAEAVPAADVERYYAEHADDFVRPEEVRARHILVKVDESQSAEEAEAKMAAARARLARGEAFEQVAAAVSEDPGSKDRGGDLGYFGRGRMIQEFESAAFGAAPGTLVGPVRTSFGLHLIEVLDHRPGGSQPLAEVEARIRIQLAGERAEAAAEARARALAERVASEKLTAEGAWQGLAEGETVTFVTTAPFGREDAVPGIGRNPDFAAAAFALGQPGEASAPVRLPRGWALLRLREIRPAHAAELTEVEARVRAAAERENARQLAHAELTAARARLLAGTPLEEVARALGLEVRDSGEFGRSGSVPGLGAAAPLADAFSLSAGQLGGPVDTGSGVALYELVSRTPFDPVAFAAGREAKRDELRQAEAQRLLASLIAERRKATAIAYDPRLAEQFKLGGARTS
jgi:peptidyl-prolyl cis-trans isomerase D